MPSGCVVHVPKLSVTALPSVTGSTEFGTQHWHNDGDGTSCSSRIPWCIALQLLDVIAAPCQCSCCHTKLIYIYIYIHIEPVCERRTSVARKTDVRVSCLDGISTCQGKIPIANQRVKPAAVHTGKGIRCSTMLSNTSWCCNQRACTRICCIEIAS